MSKSVAEANAAAVDKTNAGGELPDTPPEFVGVLPRFSEAYKLASDAGEPVPIGVSGTVRSGSELAAHARVLAGSADDPAEVVALADGAGKFSTDALPRGAWVWAESADGRLRSLRHLARTVANGPTGELDLWLQDTDKLAVEVRAVDGTPVPGALIVVGGQPKWDGGHWGAQRTLQLSELLDRATTDAAGRAIVAKPHANVAKPRAKAGFQLSVWLDGRVAWEARMDPNDDGPWQESGAIRIALRAPIELTGTVRSEDGRPVPNALVVYSRQRRRVEVRSSEGGSFRFSALTGRYSMYATLEDSPDSGAAIHFGRPLEAGVPEKVELVLAKRRAIHGRASGRDDEPLVGWTVVLLTEDKTEEQVSVRTDADGKFAICSPFGAPATLRLFPPGLEGGAAHAVRREVRASDGFVSFEYLEAPTRVFGRLDLDDLPPEIRPSLVLRGDAFPEPLWVDVDRDTGEWTSPPLPALSIEWEVIVPTVGTLGRREVTPTPGRDLDLGPFRVPRGQTVRVRLIGAEVPRKLVGWKLEKFPGTSGAYVIRTGGPRRYVSQYPDGFSLPDVVPGTYYLGVRAEGDWFGSARVEVTASIPAVIVTLRPCRRVVVQVTKHRKLSPDESFHMECEDSTGVYELPLAKKQVSGTGSLFWLPVEGCTLRVTTSGGLAAEVTLDREAIERGEPVAVRLR